MFIITKDVSKDHWRNKNYNESFPDTFRWTGTILSGVTIAGFGVRLPSINKDVAQNIELRYHYSAKDILDGYSLGTYSAKRKNPTHYGQIGDSYIVLSYQIIFNLDKTFVYDHKGRISR